MDGWQPAPGRRVRPSPIREKHSSEFVGYLVMGHLVDYYDRHLGGCTPFHLTTKVPELNSQRQERVQELLELLAIRGYVRVTRSERVSIYEATPDGAQWYKEKARGFYSVFGRLYSRPPS